MEKIDTSDAPVFILMLDNEEIIFEYQDIQGFEPDHIKKIIVSKDNKDLEKYNTDVGIVCIYPKRRYRKLFRKEFVSEEIKNGT